MRLQRGGDALGRVPDHDDEWHLQLVGDTARRVDDVGRIQDRPDLLHTLGATELDRPASQRWV